MPRARLFWLLIALGFGVRLLLIVTSIGTTDVILNLVWADLARKFGIAGAYAHNGLLNHPPLSLAIMHGEDLLARLLGLNYTDVYRFVQVLADALTTFVLYRLGGRWPALFFALSPAAAFVSGFHCNTDATMIALTITAAWLVVRPDRRAAVAGLVLGLAVGIKIVPLLLVPFFLLVLARKEIAPFLAAFAATCFVIFVPAAVIGGPDVLRNIFGYSGLVRFWGFLLIWPKYTAIGKFVVIAVIAGIAVVAARVRDDGASLLAACGAALLGILFVAPGFGVQYLDWPLPFLPFALGRRSAVAMNAMFSILLFVTYTVWNGGWPWWFADIAEPRRYDWLPGTCGVAVWIGCGLAAVSAIRRIRQPR